MIKTTDYVICVLSSAMFLVTMACNEPQGVDKSNVDPAPSSTTMVAPSTKQPDTYPLYPGCTENDYTARRACANKKLVEALHSVMHYPKHAEDHEQDAIVVHAMTIDSLGHMSSLECTKSVDEICDRAAREAIMALFKKSGPWEPATLDGRKVTTLFELPIRF